MVVMAMIDPFNRCDLNTPWVENTLNGMSAFGAIDAKITSASLSKTLQTNAVWYAIQSFITVLHHKRGSFAYLLVQWSNMGFSTAICLDRSGTAFLGFPRTLFSYHLFCCSGWVNQTLDSPEYLTLTLSPSSLCSESNITPLFRLNFSLIYCMTLFLR